MLPESISWSHTDGNLTSAAFAARSMSRRYETQPVDVMRLHLSRTRLDLMQTAMGLRVVARVGFGIAWRPLGRDGTLLTSKGV